MSTGRLYCAAFARHCFALGGGSNCPSHYLCGDHDAVGTRLAVCVRLCLSSRVECGRVCRGVLAAKFSIPTRLPRCHQPPVPWAVNNLAQPLGSKISLSTQTGGRTEHLRFGCRTLLLRSFFSRLPPRNSVKRAASRPIDSCSGALQATASISSLKIALPLDSSPVPRPLHRLRHPTRSVFPRPCGRCAAPVAGRHCAAC